MANFGPLAAERSGSLGHPSKFQLVSCVGSVTARARQSSIGHQPNNAVFNRGRHLYSAGRPSRWALAHISGVSYFIWSVIFRPHCSYVDKAYCYRRMSVVCLFICRSVMIVRPAKMAKPVEMPFELWSRMRPTKHVLDGVQIPTRRRQLSCVGRFKSIVKHRIWGNWVKGSAMQKWVDRS